LGGSTLPEHWYGGGADVNRATAAEMGDPTFKILSCRQTLWGHILAEVCQYAVNSRLAVGLGAMPDPEDVPEEYRVGVSWPEMVASDTSKYAAALLQVVSAAAQGVERGLISQATAVALIAAIAGRLGVEIDADAELADALEEAARVAEEDAFGGATDVPEESAAEPAA